MHEESSLHDYLGVLRRRKWLVLLAVVLVPAVAVVLSLRQKPEYEATAEVLLSRQNLAALLNSATDQSLTGDPARLAQTQADLAQAPQVASRTWPLRDHQPDSRPSFSPNRASRPRATPTCSSSA